MSKVWLKDVTGIDEDEDQDEDDAGGGEIVWARTYGQSMFTSTDTASSCYPFVPYAIHSAAVERKKG